MQRIAESIYRGKEMRPDKISVLRLFEERQQYLIPLFQRGYVWTLSDQIQPLWEDLIDRADALLEFKSNAEKVGGTEKLRTMRKHFLGTVVIGGPKGGSSDTIPTREVIDGQQRITTFQILLLAFRDVVKPLQDEAIDDDLKKLTRNVGKYREKVQHLKVWPTNAGRDVMQSLFELESVEAVCQQFPARGAKRAKIERPLMVQAYLFFYTLLSAHLRGIRFDDSSNAPTDELEELLAESMGNEIKEEPTVADAVIASIGNDNLVWTPRPDVSFIAEKAYSLQDTLRDGFQIMSLELDDEDDPQIIFETLNARGAPLQPSDLIRNFVFLQATRKGEDVDALYNEYWKPFDEKPDENDKKAGERFWRKEVRQGRLTSVRLDLLLYYYVGLRKCEDLKVAHVFGEFKDWWESASRDTSTELRRITKLAKDFEVLLLPNQTSRLGLFGRRMQLLDTSTLTPLVFYFLEHHDAESLEMRQILDDLESYVVRRFVCGMTTKGYNRIFTNRLLAELSKEGRFDAAALRNKLRGFTGESQHWPSDSDFEQGWCYRALYRGRNTSKVRSILEALELAQRSTKQESMPLPDGLTVEHVMPQKWEAHWPVPDASVEALANRKRLLHSIGNLTMVTANFNSALSNESFIVKRAEIVKTSLLMLNTYFQGLAESNVWDESSIRLRATKLFGLAKEIWARP
jgi:Protein of unknown function DUF262/Protein of unknown function (DUF1524)